ncbi:SCAN domain-containing protein 3 [Oopsacas minuta]|uniref:SCAN domain-containing protein 3 n=1 Tax=Oopsacas minuta TaxID=111878 RepID=A0AAV7JIE5_9METZ|nr:SCAN domain-containing protein 3 [Oopsacas minuta]
MLGESAAKTTARVPLSNDTVARRVIDLACDMEEQLIEQIKSAKWYSLQLDESTDVANLAILLLYVRFEHCGDVKEEYLCSISFPTNTTSSQIFDGLNNYIVDESGLDWKFCVGVRTDGAATMTGRHSGVVAKIKEVAPDCESTHCFIHRENLATKKMSKELNDVLCQVVKVVNHVKANALNSRLFASLCDQMGADHIQLLLHAEVRFLSRGKVLSRVFELRNELTTFLLDKKREWAEKFRDVNWNTKLAYLSDIFSMLNELNRSMQGRMATNFATANKIDGFKRKLAAWQHRVSRDCYDMLPNLSEIINCESGLDATSLANIITEHLKSLAERFEFYFPKEQDPREGNGWICNSILQLKDELNVHLEDKLLDLAGDQGLKNIFTAK